MIPHIQTLSGEMIPLWQPQPCHIHLADIAHALAGIPRFNGHTRQPWSVAQHSLLVLALLDPEITTPEERLAALLHDAHEAYIGDITSPVAAAIRGQRDACQIEGLKAIFNTAIAARFGLDPALFHHPIIIDADRKALAIEHSRYMSTPTKPWPDLPPVPPDAPPGHEGTPGKVQDAFLDTTATLLLARHGIIAHYVTIANVTPARERGE